jgi:hypothetical protein
MTDDDLSECDGSTVALWVDREPALSMDANMSEIHAGRPAGIDAPPSEDVDASALVDRGFEAFLRDLPELLADRRNYRKLVAYRGDRQIAIAATQKQLFRKCRHIPEHEIFIECIAPQPLEF